MKNKKPDTSWGSVAGWYDKLLQSDDTFQTQVILPNVTRLVGPKAGMKILDVACGQGFFSQAFALAGATVMSADISPELIALAEKQKKSLPVEVASRLVYHVASADKLSFVADKSIDVAVIVLAIQNIENVAGVFAEISRTLVSGGRFYLVLNHPAFRIPKRSSWGWDETGKTQYRRIDAYLSESREKILMNPGQVAQAGGASAGTNTGVSIETVSFHRPLQFFFKALEKAGFTVSHLEEWISHRQSQNGPRGAEEDRTRKEIPLFLCLEGVKK